MTSPPIVGGELASAVDFTIPHRVNPIEEAVAVICGLAYLAAGKVGASRPAPATR